MDIEELANDFAAERRDLLALLDGREPIWDEPTPAAGWSILDQLIHLAWFDDATRQAITDPAAFRAQDPDLVGDIDRFVEQVRVTHHDRPGADVVVWLEQSGDALCAAAIAADPSQRFPWYGPDMTLASLLTARIMETWAHGQDIADALHVDRDPSPRLPHVAFLGAKALPYSFLAHGRPAPEVPVRIEAGGWTFGPDDASDIVRGPLVDFCLVVTQRRHVADTALTAEGPVASEWITIAQAFAGPPGAGRTPGQFD